jgi:hypothetical protein
MLGVSGEVDIGRGSDADNVPGELNIIGRISMKEERYGIESGQDDVG